MAEPKAKPDGPSGRPGLTVTSSGTDGRVIVASDALLTQLDALGRLADDLRQGAGSLLAVLAEEPQASLAFAVPTAAIEARELTRAALGALLRAHDLAELIAHAVRSALAEYAQTEQFAQAIGHRVGEEVAWAVGAGARLFGLPFLWSASTGMIAAAAMAGVPVNRIPSALQDFLKLHGRILTNTATVAIVRELAADANGIGAGFLLVPPQANDLLDTAHITTSATSSDAVVAAGRTIGLFEPSSAAVRKTSSFEFGSPPTSLVARSQSFPRPDGDPNGEQIRIDRYVEAGKPDRFDVFIAGTVTFDPKTARQPFDLTSDLNGVGNESSASYEAVVEAMKQAGVTAHSPVVLNGYSQGGLLASQVAASGHFDVRGVVTFGAPSAQVPVPASIPVLTVRNAEDLVPATSGYDTNPHAVVVERPVFPSGPVESDRAVPAHELSAYQETAAIVDQSRSSAVRGVLDPLNRFGSGATRVDSTLWLATRVPAG